MPRHGSPLAAMRLQMTFILAVAGCNATPAMPECPSGTTLAYSSKGDALEAWCQKHDLQGTAIKHGPRTLWYPGGRKYLEGQYQEGRPVGTWRHWLFDGRLRSEQLFRDDGSSHRVFWSADGHREAEDSFDHDGTGTSADWYENGTKWRERTFRNHKPHGQWTVWDERGNVMKRATYRDGQLVDGSDIHAEIQEASRKTHITIEPLGDNLPDSGPR